MAPCPPSVVPFLKHAISKTWMSIYVMMDPDFSPESRKLYHRYTAGLLDHPPLPVRRKKTTSSTLWLPRIDKDSPPPDGSFTPEMELEYLARVAFLTVTASPTPDWLHDHIDPTFKIDFDNFPSAQTWAETLETCRIVADSNPRYRPAILEVFVDIHEHNTHAEVFLIVETTGRPHGLRRKSVTREKWRRRDRKWLLYNILAIRAPCYVYEESG